MSLETWEQEFGHPYSLTSKVEAAEASLWRWIGKLPENINKHGITQCDLPIHCPLCRVHEKQINPSLNSCLNCPLNEVSCCLQEGSSFQEHTSNDPESIWRLIEDIARALDLAIEEEQNEL